jgi:hypothetical protein
MILRVWAKRAVGLFFPALTATLGFCASASLGDTYVGQITLDTGPYQSGVGGEFTAELNPVAGPITTGMYKNSTGIATPLDIESQASPVNPYQHSPIAPYTGTPTPANAVYFQTFCIEGGNHDVDFYPGNWGGPNYSAYLVDQPQLASGSWLTLSPVTASLYDAFWDGKLAAADLPANSTYLGYDYNNDPGRNISAGILQDAIWVAQGDFGPTSSYSAVVAAAQAATGEAGISTLESQQAVDLYYLALHGKLQRDGNTVDVLNLIDAGGGSAQAQLVEVPAAITSPTNVISSPVPLPASAGVGFAMLGGFGIVAIVLRRGLPAGSRWLEVT